MENQSELEMNDTHSVWGFLGGLLVGGLAGSVAMLLVAPQSGKRTRAKIQQRSIELRDQAGETVEDAVAQTRHKARQIKASVQDQAEAIQQRGQDVLDDQKKRLSTLVESGKTTVQGVFSSRT